MTDYFKLKKRAGTGAKRKRSPAMTATIILMFLLIVLMITLAFFTSVDEVTNVFNAGNVDIVLTESEWKPADAQNIVPGTVLDKNPKITNNDEMDVYVFLKVTVPYDELKIENSTDQKGKAVFTGEVPLYKFVVTDEYGTDSFQDSFDNVQKVGKGWLLLSGYPTIDNVQKTYTYVYAHTQDNGRLLPLMKQHTTQYALFDKIRLMNFNEQQFDPQRDYSVRVEAYGIQTNFLKENNTTTTDPEEVWGIINR